MGFNSGFKGLKYFLAAGTYLFSFHGSTSPVGLDFLLVEVQRSHSDTPHSVGLLWPSDRPVAETSIRQHTTLTEDSPPCPRRP